MKINMPDKGYILRTTHDCGCCELTMPPVLMYHHWLKSAVVIFVILFISQTYALPSDIARSSHSHPPSNNRGNGIKTNNLMNHVISNIVDNMNKDNNVHNSNDNNNNNNVHNSVTNAISNSVKAAVIKPIEPGESVPATNIKPVDTSQPVSSGITRPRPGGPPIVQPIKETDNDDTLKLLLGNETDFTNDTVVNNVTETTASQPTTTKAPEKTYVDLPQKGEAEHEHHQSMTIFFILIVIAICIMIVHLLIQTKFHYLPESIAIITMGALIGLVLKILSVNGFSNLAQAEAFPPNMFFIVMLPPIIFESGYNLHKGNFFQNIGSILVFAIFGTVISALVIGGGVYLLGQADVAYRLDLFESFAFGALISAVDPVATLAIFQALDVDRILFMLVFGESVLNDAVSIVLTAAVVEASSPENAAMTGLALFFQAGGRFLVMFFGSALLGSVFGVLSAIMLKFFDLRKTPSLELGLLLIFSYLPYGLAEGLRLSGIMAILFAGIVMSHYTHLNLSPVTQITVQQTFRTMAFMAETVVFAYLGLAIFSFKHVIKPSFVIWGIVLCIIGRLVNIFPLSFILNYFREHKITKRMQCIMVFSGLRGAIAFALSLHLEFEEEKHQVLVTSTLIIVLVTVVIFGGGTMPMLKLLNQTKRKKVHPDRELTLSKTKEMGETIDSEHLSELTEEECEVTTTHVHHVRGFMKIDQNYLVPFLTRRFTQQEVRDGKKQMTKLTDQWYKEVRAVSSDDDDEEEFDLVHSPSRLAH